MKLQTSVLDKALEWLIPKIGDPDIPKVLIMNYDSTDEVDALQAYCVWCLRLRYNLVEYQKNGIDVNDYGTWRPETRWQSKNLTPLLRKLQNSILSAAEECRHTITDIMPTLVSGLTREYSAPITSRPFISLILNFGMQCKLFFLLKPRILPKATENNLIKSWNWK